MQEVEPLKYTVVVGEVIDVVVTPTGTGVFLAASLDGHTLSPLPGTETAPNYRFLVNRPVGRTHFLAMEFSFPGAATRAKYDVAVSGDHGGSAGFAISKDDSVKDPFLRFKVTS
jgi:hypothetical protein